MRGEGTAVFGGAIAGGVECNITLANGEKWRFLGAVFGFEIGFGGAKVAGGQIGTVNGQGAGLNIPRAEASAVGTRV